MSDLSLTVRWIRVLAKPSGAVLLRFPIPWIRRR